MADDLSTPEGRLLAAAIQLHDRGQSKATGYQIGGALTRTLGRAGVAFGALYTTLEALTARGYLASRVERPEELGGRLAPRRLYWATPEGRAASAAWVDPLTPKMEPAAVEAADEGNTTAPAGQRTMMI